MFGGTKPGFGATSTNTGFGFNNATTTPQFGQSAFAKPPTTAFAQTPSFGAQQANNSMFGAATPQTQSTGLFGGAGTSTAFGSTANTQPAFGAFQQPQQNTSIFGPTQTAANTSSLFGQNTNLGFGAAVKPTGLGTFGPTTTQTNNSVFGQTATASSTSGFGSFGQPTATTTNVFGSTANTAFGQTATAATTTLNAGTSLAKYQPTVGTDTLIKGGQPNNVNTKQHCITAMKEYEAKSLEELRMEDYLNNRKGPQAGNSGFFATNQQTGNTSTGLFGTGAQVNTNLFGQTTAAATDSNKLLFGGNTFGQTNNTSAFGATTQNNFLAKAFGATPTNAFGATTTDAANPFGVKPAFGQTNTPSLFSATPASTATAFSTNTGGFSGFGSTAAQPTLFGGATSDANKPAFGLGSGANNTFTGFGATATNAATSSPFAAKPTTGFGATNAFGATSTANTGFSNFSLGNAAANTGGLFNSTLNKPATSGFGAFGAQPSTGLNFNSGTTGTSLFGNTAAKPAGFFSTSLGTAGTNTGTTSLFGNTSSAFGSSLGGAFGSNALGGTNTLTGLGATQQTQQVPIHQQILAKVSSPYGDNAIFKDLKRSDEVDATRATNPAAQKAILESNSGQQFKVAAKNSPTVKVKPVTNALSKKSLFEGLEEYDASVETFTLKPNAKRLILKPKVVNSINHDTSNGEINQSTPSFIKEKQKEIQNEEGEKPKEIVHENGNERRESWLHPNNLQKVRQQNLNSNSGGDSSPLNSTLSELVPRKPLETYRNIAARPSVSTVIENPFEERTSHNTSHNTSANLARSVTFNLDNVNESIFSNRSFNTDEQSSIVHDEPQAEYDEHPTGITMKRVG